MIMRWITVASIISCMTAGAAAQQRSTKLAWSGQRLVAGTFNVHKVEAVLGEHGAAESLEIVVSAQKIEHFETLNIWIRHGALPTPENHHTHAVLQVQSRGRHGKKNEVSMHVRNPLQGDWYIVVAPGGSIIPSETPAMEVNEHQFIQEPGLAEYSVTSTAAGCDRGRFGYPTCESNWMQLSWGKEAQFVGELGSGKDVWTCRCGHMWHKRQKAGKKVQSSHPKWCCTQVVSTNARFTGRHARYRDAHTHTQPTPETRLHRRSALLWRQKAFVFRL